MTAFGERKRMLKRFADDRCGGKIPCDSELSARLLAQGAINLSNTGQRATMLWVYRCPECDRWHMTSCGPRPGQPKGNPVTATSLGMERPA